MARQPADRDHRFGHWKIEDLASLVTSIIMFYVRLRCPTRYRSENPQWETTVIDPLGPLSELDQPLSCLRSIFIAGL